MPYPAFDFLNIFASSFERRSKQIVKPQKKNVWQYINQNKTLHRPISPTTARKPQANASPTKSIPGMPANTLKKNNEVSNKPLLAALQATGNPERELSSAELNQMKRRTPAPAKSSPQNNSKSSSPSSESLEKESSPYE